MKYMYYRNALTSESLHPDKKKKKSYSVKLELNYC